MTRKFLVGCLLLFLVSCLDETRVDPATPATFVRYINGGNNDLAMAMEKTSDGGYIILANTTTTVTNGTEERLVDKIKLVKVNAYGSVLWSRVLPETAPPDTVAGYRGNGIYASDQGYIISGEVIYTDASDKSQLLIVGTNELGQNSTYAPVDLISARGWVGPGVTDSITGHVSGLAVTKVLENDFTDTHFIVMASVTDLPKNMILAELNFGSSPPSVTWDRLYGSAASAPINKIFLDASQAVVIAGTVTYENQTDLRVVKAAQNSPSSFDDQKYGQPDRNERASNICRTPNGFAIIGSTDVAGKQDRDIYFARVGNSGDTLSTRRFPVYFPGTTEDVQKNEEGNALCTTSDNGFIILATIQTSISNEKVLGRGETDYYLMKVNAFGDVDWTRAFGSLREDIGVSVVQAEDGGYLILGRTRLANLWTITLIKTNSLGEIE